MIDNKMKAEIGNRIIELLKDNGKEQSDLKKELAIELTTISLDQVNEVLGELKRIAVVKANDGGDIWYLEPDIKLRNQLNLRLCAKDFKTK